MDGVQLLWQSMGIANMEWGQVFMMLVGCLLVWLAVVKKFEPLLLVPIGFGAVLFSVSFIVFVSDHAVWNVVVGNLGLGAGMTITTVSSTIFIQQLVPNEVRGRIMSIFQLNMGFAQLMTMPIAVLGQWLTLPVLFPLLAIATTAFVGLILVTRRQILRA